MRTFHSYIDTSKSHVLLVFCVVQEAHCAISGPARHSAGHRFGSETISPGTAGLVLRALEESYGPKQSRCLRNVRRILEPDPGARAATQALNNILPETHPGVKRGMDEYARRLTTLKNRLN